MYRGYSGHVYSGHIITDIMIPRGPPRHITKIRSPASAETDHFDCLEALGSPRPQATGFPGLPGSQNDQFMY